MKPVNILCILTCVVTLTSCINEGTQNASAFTETKSLMTDASYTTLPSAPIHIAYQMEANTQVGIPITIVLNITPLTEARQLSIEYFIEGALYSGDPQMRFDFGATGKDNTQQQPIIVVPQAQGHHRVIVTAVIENDKGHRDSQTIAIPIVVGDVLQTPALPHGARMSTDSQDNPVIVLPMEEEIIIQ